MRCPQRAAGGIARPEFGGAGAAAWGALLAKQAGRWPLRTAIPVVPTQCWWGWARDLRLPRAPALLGAHGAYLKRSATAQIC